MSAQISLENCVAFLNWQWQAGVPRPGATAEGLRRAITISRQAGSGAHTIAETLAVHLQDLAPKDAPPWTVFDHNLVEQVLADHHLPQRLAQYMPEDRISELQDSMDELFGLHPSARTLVHQTSESLLRLGSLGHVILIGRGANIVTSRLPGVLHVRLVAPFEQRVAHMQELRKLTRKAARAVVRREDRGRARYLKKYFRANIDDPLLYHLVINTGFVSYDAAVKIITEALRVPGAG